MSLGNIDQLSRRLQVQTAESSLRLGEVNCELITRLRGLEAQIEEKNDALKWWTESSQQQSAAFNLLLSEKNMWWDMYSNANNKVVELQAAYDNSAQEVQRLEAKKEELRRSLAEFTRTAGDEVQRLGGENARLEAELGTLRTQVMFLQRLPHKEKTVKAERAVEAKEADDLTAPATKRQRQASAHYRLRNPKNDRKAESKEKLTREEQFEAAAKYGQRMAKKGASGGDV